MPEKSRVPSIPLIGKSGLLAIVGFLIGVFSNNIFEKYVADATGRKQLWNGFYVHDLLMIVLPLVLMAVVKRFRAFFLGWFLGALATEVVPRMERITIP